MNDLDLLNRIDGDGLKSAIGICLSTAGAFARVACPRCYGKGYEVIEQPNGFKKYNYCTKSRCSEYNIRKANSKS